MRALSLSLSQGEDGWIEGGRRVMVSHRTCARGHERERERERETGREHSAPGHGMARFLALHATSVAQAVLHANATVNRRR